MAITAHQAQRDEMVILALILEMEDLLRYPEQLASAALANDVENALNNCRATLEGAKLEAKNGKLEEL